MPFRLASLAPIVLIALDGSYRSNRAHDHLTANFVPPPLWFMLLP